MKSLVFAVLAALAVACTAPIAPPPTSGCRTFVVSSGFANSEKAGLIRAVRRWNEVAIEPYCLELNSVEDAERVSNGVFPIRYGGAYWRELSSRDGKNLAGEYFHLTGQIGIVDNLDSQLFEVVALHEFGHAHGLSHTKAPSIMHATTGTVLNFTPNDMAECQRVGACRKDDLDGGE